MCSVRRALVLLLKEKAEILEHRPRAIRGVSRDYPSPHVIRLVYRVKVPRYEARRMSRRALFARDGYACQYCGSRAKLTVDHVVPRSRGGDSSWFNVVTSCATCNARKGDALCDEVHMYPRSKPRPPRPDVFIDVATPRRPEEWTPYLAAA
ncbi:MAG: HNH endonuclease [Actinobacteria bacterium]|nr:HNH endonuclease [Actinomycetota bacterium]